MAKFEIKFDAKKLEIELNKQIQKIVEKEGIKAELVSSWQGEELKTLDKMMEQALAVILSQYDGNSQLSVNGNYGLFPEYMHFNIKDVFLKLKLAGLIASHSLILDGWRVNLTPDGISYFPDKKSALKEKLTMFEKLSNKAEDLLTEILLSDNYQKMLLDRLDANRIEENNELERLLIELSDYGLIQILWGDGIPTEICTNNPAWLYFERKDENEQSLKKGQGNKVHIEKFISNGSNVFFGDVTGSSFSIDNSVQRIEDRIEKDGGKDKEELKLLLEEAKELVENIVTSRNIPKNKRFFTQLSSHLEKHGWFYGEIVGLIGATTLALLQG